MVQRPSSLWNCTGAPASSFMEERIAQPWALTTNVSHTSEKPESGSRLVTRIGRATGSLELRRESDRFGACMVVPSGIVCALLVSVAWDRALSKVTLEGLQSLARWCLFVCAIGHCPPH